MGIILLLIVGGYITFGIALTSDLKRKAKRNSIIFFISFPLLMGFSFVFRPSFYHFVSLCSDHDTRNMINPVELSYVPEIAGCELGLRTMMLKNYDGYECKISVENSESSKDKPKFEDKMFRFTKNELWNSKPCAEMCAKKFYERECQNKCLQQSQIDTPNFGINKNYYRQNFGSGPTFMHVMTIMDSNKNQLMTIKNYEYLPYGKGLAKYLGGSSGDAPSMSCTFEYKTYDNTDFLKPKDK